MSKTITNKNKIKEILEKGVEKIYPNAQALKKKLMLGKKIKIYCGYDPTFSTLHIGHAITLRKLSQFQKLGHEVIMLIGDFTGMIGDPSNKTSARQKLSRAQVNKNLKNYKKQASKILKFSGNNPAKIMFNSKWNDKLKFLELIELSSNFTVQQMITRDMFQKRLKEKKPIYLHEFLYPLIQAHDSVAMNVDLQIGGNDQTFNMLCARDLMNALKNKEEFILTTKLLIDSEGRKMGKTERNAIFLNEEPKEMYGKIMAWPDSLILLGLELCTGLSIKQIKKINKQMRIKQANPRDIKARLAKEIVSVHHDKTKAIQAEKEFNRIFKEKKFPIKIKVFSRKIAMKMTNVSNLMAKTRLASSNSEAKRLISQGAVKIDNEVITNWQQKIIPKKGAILRVGRRKFIKFI